jgi:hypothetical protein
MESTHLGAARCLCCVTLARRGALEPPSLALSLCVLSQCLKSDARHVGSEVVLAFAGPPRSAGGAAGAFSKDR